MRIKGLGLGGAMAIVALVGCGSSGGTGGTGGSAGTGSGKGGTTGGGGAFTTSVPAGTKLTGLTSSQATQLCKDLEGYSNSTVSPLLCNAFGSLPGLYAAYGDLQQNPTATTSELQAACAAGGVDAGSCSDLGDGGTDTCNISSIPSTCAATVGDFSKCVNDSTAAEEQFYAAIPNCSTLTATSLMAFFAADGGTSSEPPEPTSCSKFDSTCDADGGTSTLSTMNARMMPKKRK